jgi:hypothetical protein
MSSKSGLGAAIAQPILPDPLPVTPPAVPESGAATGEAPHDAEALKQRRQRAGHKALIPNS